jgi:hypothetical protein
MPPPPIVARTDAAFIIQVEIPYNSSMLDFEEVIQQKLNEAGDLATTEALGRFDADGVAEDQLDPVQSTGLQAGQSPIPADTGEEFAETRMHDLPLASDRPTTSNVGIGRPSSPGS